VSQIEQARQFLIDEVFDPPLASTIFPDKAKNILKTSKNWVEHFKKVGDLEQWLNCFWDRKGEKEPSYIVQQLEAAGFRTFEEIEKDFTNSFQSGFDDCTGLDDFVIGRKYTSWDLAIFAKTYDLRQGILLIGNDQNHEAIFIKATLSKGQYANEWITPGEILKYYFKGIKNKKTGKQTFKETFKHNAAIINSGQVQIYVFEKYETEFTLVGTFQYQSHDEDVDGAKWFRLQRRSLFNQPRRFVAKQHENELNKRVAKSRNDSSEERRRRLNNAKKKPSCRVSEVVTFDRNPDVIA